MEVSFAHLKDNQVVVTKFTQGGKEELCENTDFDIWIGNPANANTPSLTDLDISTLGHEEALSIFNNSLNDWCHQNNLNLLFNIFKTASDLKKEMQNSREKAFTNLWQILHNNLGSASLTIIFNTLGKTKKKDIIEVSTLTGKMQPIINTANEAEVATFDEYKDKNTFRYYHEENNELTIFSLTSSGPILCLVKLWQPMTFLQKLAMHQILDGLN